MLGCDDTNELALAIYTGSLECPCVPCVRWNNRLPRRFWPEPDSIFGSLSMTVPTAVHFCWTYHSACPSDHIDARSRGDLLAEISSSRRWRDVVSAASDPTVTSRAGADRLLRTEPQVRLTNLFSYRTITGTSSLFHTQALLLSMLRFSWPRISRGRDAERLRNMDCSWPQTRPGHGHDPVQCRPRTQTVRVHKQSASASCPRQQSRSQTVRKHGLATDSIGPEQAKATVMDCPQPVRSRELSTSANSPRTRFVRSRRPAENCTRSGIASTTSSPASFPIHIQPIPFYDHI